MRHIMEEYLKNFDADYIDEVIAMNIQADFLAYVYNTLKNLKMNQSELARKMRVSKSFVSEMLNGNRLISLKHIAKINRILGFYTTFRIETKEKYKERVEAERRGCIIFDQSVFLKIKQEIPLERIAMNKDTSGWKQYMIPGAYSQKSIIGVNNDQVH